MIFPLKKKDKKKTNNKFFFNVSMDLKDLIHGKTNVIRNQNHFLCLNKKEENFSFQNKTKK